VRIAAWHIKDAGPVRAPEAGPGLEKELEDWIEQDPSLVEEGLRVIARQAVLGPAGRIDLLALDSAGRGVVIEVKAGKLYRETIAQALDYAAAIRSLPAERLQSITGAYFAPGTGRTAPDSLPLFLEDGSREVTAIVVGTGADAGLDRLSNYLESFGVPIRGVAFQVFLVGERPVLVRETLDVTTTAGTRAGAGPAASVDDVLKLADAAGLGKAMRSLLAGAAQRGLHVRAFKRSLMFTPPTNRSRALVTVWSEDGGGGLFCAPEAFAEFFDLTPEEVRAELGPLDEHGWRNFDEAVADQVVAGLAELLEGAVSTKHSLASAMQVVLEQRGPLSPVELAGEISARGLYTRADHQPVPPSQVSARAARRADLFEARDGVIALRSEPG
jgi:hypothetical protein